VKNLQGRVKFPTGGKQTKVCKPTSRKADLV